jgi:ubiquinone biosynthesis O-methyltransferase
MQEKEIWFNRKGRLGQLEEKVREREEARFGFEVLGEEQKRERVRRHFDSVASRYDATNSLLSFGLHYLWKRRAVHMAGLRPGDRVLDVCGGTGDLSVLSDRIVRRRGQVVLYDINRRMMTAGRRKGTNRAARKRIRYVQGDAEQIAFPAHTFDVVMVGFAIRNITHMKQAFREMVRVLKPGGTFLCLEFSKPVSPMFRRLYDLYSFKMMPILGGVAAGDKRAYTYLPETIRTVLLPEEFAQIFRETGLTRIRYRRFTNGIAVAHTGIKPPRENLDRSEIAKFNWMASRWWDRCGDWKALHDINPLRMEFITRQAPLDGARVLDIGCGGGILSESLAEAGARVTGIDAGADTLEIARQHARRSGLSIDYRRGTVEALASSGEEKFDVITCMELLEHVPDPRSIISACARLLNPGGNLICATVSRSMKSFLFAIIGAEYILRLLPVGSHDHGKFIKPDELAAWGKESGLKMQSVTGLGYNPFTRRYFLSGDLRVNYILHLRKPDAGFETQEQ